MTAAFLSPALLRDPAQRSVRVIAQGRLQQVLEEAARVDVRVGGERRAGPRPQPDPSPADPEAVHDFRVALRRLRVWLRAFRPYLADTVRHGAERRLRALSLLAGKARDLEVQLAWLIGPGPRRTGPTREAAGWLAKEVAGEQARARRMLVAGLVAELPETAVRLAGELRHYHQDVELDEPVQDPMATAMADALRRAIGAAAGSLQRVVRPDQVEEAHAARIAVKRLRYLVEGVGPAARSVTGILPQLAALQHRFGELHDAQVLQRRLLKARSVRKRAGAARRGAGGRAPRYAMVALRALLSRRAGIAFRRARRAIRSQATAQTFIRLAALARRLERAR